MNMEAERAYSFFINRSLYSAASSSYYEWKQFPIKFSLQHFVNQKKNKHRTHQVSRQNNIAKSFDVIDAKIKILKAQKNQYGFPIKSPQKSQARIAENVKKRAYTEPIEQIPELCIGKQPIRFQSQCEKKKINIRYCDMKIIKKKIKSEKSMSPISKSIVLINPEQEKMTHMMTQLIQGNETLEVAKLGIKSRKNIKRLKDSRKVKTQAASKRTFRSQDKIKGWDVRQKDYDEIAQMDSK